MTKKEYLKQARIINKLITTAMQEKPLTQLTSDAVNLKHLLDIDIKHLLDIDIKRLMQLKYNITLLINQIPNQIHRQILFERYINFRSWTEIAIKTYYSLTSVRTLHAQALREFAKYFKTSSAD